MFDGNGITTPISTKAPNQFISHAYVALRLEMLRAERIGGLDKCWWETAILGSVSCNVIRKDNNEQLTVSPSARKSKSIPAESDLANASNRHERSVSP